MSHSITTIALSKAEGQPKPAMQKIKSPTLAWSLVQTSVDGLCSFGSRWKGYGVVLRWFWSWPFARKNYPT